MNYETMITQMTPDIYRALKLAIEIGKWPDGKRLTDEQRANCMAAVISYDNTHLQTEDRVAYIDRGSKSEGEQCDDSAANGDRNGESPLKWS